MLRTPRQTLSLDDKVAWMRVHGAALHHGLPLHMHRLRMTPIRLPLAPGKTAVTACMPVVYSNLMIPARHQRCRCPVQGPTLFLRSCEMWVHGAALLHGLRLHMHRQQVPPTCLPMAPEMTVTVEACMLVMYSNLMIPARHQRCRSLVHGPTLFGLSCAMCLVLMSSPHQNVSSPHLHVSSMCLMRAQQHVCSSMGPAARVLHQSSPRLHVHEPQLHVPSHHLHVPRLHLRRPSPHLHVRSSPHLHVRSSPHWHMRSSPQLQMPGPGLNQPRLHSLMTLSTFHDPC
jgi:hypothetical protein